MIKYFKILIIFLLFIFLLPNQVMAQRLGCGGGFGPIADFLCKLSGGTGVAQTRQVGSRLNTVLSGILGFLTVVAALWFVIQFIIAGYNWINAGGDKNAAQAAWQKITNAVVGLLVVVLAWVIIGVIGRLIGLEILNPGSLLEKLSI